jgi:hypothetical protein
MGAAPGEKNRGEHEAGGYCASRPYGRSRSLMIWSARAI